MTLVLPSIVATPFFTETVKCSTLIFDFANFARIFCSIAESGRACAGLAGTVLGRATGFACPHPAMAMARISVQKIFFTAGECTTQSAGTLYPHSRRGD